MDSRFAGERTSGVSYVWSSTSSFTGGAMARGPNDADADAREDATGVS